MFAKRTTANSRRHRAAKEKKMEFKDLTLIFGLPWHGEGMRVIDANNATACRVSDDGDGGEEIVNFIVQAANEAPALAATQAENARLREVVERCKQGNLNLVELGLLHGGYAEEALRIADECASALTATPAPSTEAAPEPPQRNLVAELKAEISQVESFLAEMPPESIIERISFQSRLDHLNAELAAAPAPALFLGAPAQAEQEAPAETRPSILDSAITADELIQGVKEMAEGLASAVPERDYEAEARAIARKKYNEGYRIVVLLEDGSCVFKATVSEPWPKQVGFKYFNLGGIELIADSLRRGHTYDD